MLVTGAGSGVGEEVAHLSAEYGYSVACVDANFNAADRVARELDGSAISLGCDVRDPQAVRRMLSNALAELGHLDVVVNAASTANTTAFEELTLDQWDALFATNLRATFLVSRAVFPLMKEAGSGHLVNIAPLGAPDGVGAAGYHASVWALLGFSRGLDAEARSHGVRVTAVIPATMRTNLLDRFTDSVLTIPDQETSGALFAREILIA